MPTLIAILKKSLQVYVQNFWLFVKILSPLLFPIVVLRLIARYTYLGQLAIIYSTVFGFILSFVILFFVSIILINATYHLIVVESNESQARISLKGNWGHALRIFISYAYLTIVIGLIIGSVPFLLGVLNNYLPHSTLTPLVTLLTMTWVTSVTLLFLFSYYALIIENYRGRNALERGIGLFLMRPIYITFALVGTTLASGAILIFLSALTSLVIALITKETNILFSPYFSPWWQDLVIDIYAILGLPLLVIASSLLFNHLKKSGTPMRVSPLK